MKKQISQKYFIFGICFLIILLFIVSLSQKNNITTIAYAQDKSEIQKVANKALNETCGEDYDSVYIDYQGGHITQEQTFVIPFVVKSEKNMIDFNYKQNGFNVKSTKIINSKQLNFKLSCISNNNDYNLLLQIKLESGKTIKSNLYAVVYDCGVFISQFSKEDALEKYFGYSLKNKTLTEADIEELRSEIYSSNVITKGYTVMGKDPNFKEPITNEAALINQDSSLESKSLETKSSADTYLQGTLEWEDDNGNTHPLRRTLVKVYDYDGTALPGHYLGSTYTDNQGEYSFEFINKTFLENGGYDLYIMPYAGTSNAMVQNSSGIEYYCNSDKTKYMNVATGSTTTIDLIVKMDDDSGKAFQISQAVLTARDFAWNMMDSMPSDIVVRYPEDDHCYYTNANSRITITGSAYVSWDVIMHEYGHHIQYDLDIINSPGGSHSSFENDADARNDKDEGIRLAWAESWPTVFGIMAQKYRSSYLTNIDTVNDTSYEAYNGVNYNIDTTTVTLGEACEQSIMAVLWDIYDSGTETNDTISLGYQSWWDVTTDGQDKTFSDFISYFYSEYPQYIDDIGANLSYYKMAPGNINNSSTLTSTPPTFNWAAQGGSTRFPNNSFTVWIYSEDFSSQIGLITSTTSRTPTQNQWDIILNWSGKTIHVAVETYQNDSPITGRYVSEYIELEKLVYKYNVTSGSVTITDTYFNLSGNVIIPSYIDSLPVSSIGESAFAYQDDITKITFPSTINIIGNRAFQSCSNLATVNLSQSSVTMLEAYTFANCAIKTISFPNTLTTIGECAFINAGNIKELPNSIISIGNFAFKYITSTSIIISSSTTIIGDKAFYGCNSLTIYAEVNSRLSGWNTSWNNSNRPVVWGCVLSSDKSYVKSFTKSSSNPSNANAQNGITNPYRKGYTFKGWYTTSDYSGTQYMDLATAPNGTLYAKWYKPSSCVAEGTLITLADGTQVAVEDLTGDENLLVWNMETGSFDIAPMLFIDSDPYKEYEIIHLYFSDGTEVKVIDEHAFWDIDLNKYVFFRDDADKYIGHWYNKQTEDSNGNMTYTAVQLVNVEIYNEYTTAWSPVTYGHLCFYVNGMLSMPGATEGLINIFNVNADTMQIDEDSYQEDIEEYGLFTYEEFSEIHYIPEEVFDAFNIQYFKISMGKGLLDWETIEFLIERYSTFFDMEETDVNSNQSSDSENINNDDYNHGGNGNHCGHHNHNGRHNNNHRNGCGRRNGYYYNR